MAMFEIDDSKDVTLLRCETDAEVLIKGKGLPGLRAEDCRVTQSSKPTATNKTRTFLVWVMGIVATVISGYLIKIFGFN